MTKILAWTILLLLTPSIILRITLTILLLTPLDLLESRVAKRYGIDVYHPDHHSHFATRAAYEYYLMVDEWMDTLFMRRRGLVNRLIDWSLKVIEN